MTKGNPPLGLQKRPSSKKEAEKKRQGKKYKHIYYFYVQFRDADGKYTSAISTGHAMSPLYIEGSEEILRNDLSPIWAQKE